LKFTDFDLQFSHEELRAYLNSLKEQNLKRATIETHRTAIRVWWDVLGLLWPKSKRPKHHLRTEVVVLRPPTFTKERIVEPITLVKERGSPQQRYYFTMASIYAPRAGELGAITARNFDWKDGTGVLTFQPLNHRMPRQHRIPEILIPYLKGYSYEAQGIPSWKMDYPFHYWCNGLGFKLPRPAKKQIPDSIGGIQTEKGHNQHAFRRSLDTELIEAGVREAIISQWMGWNSQPGMVRRYYTPDLSAANLIMSKHPFLEYCR